MDTSCGYIDSKTFFDKFDVRPELGSATAHDAVYLNFGSSYYYTFEMIQRDDLPEYVDR